MKNTIAVMIIAAMTLVACDDQEIKDPLAGEWTFKSGDAPIRATFALTAGYTIPKSEVLYTYQTTLIPTGYGIGISKTNDAFTARVKPGREIGLISISNSHDYSLELRGCKYIEAHRAFSVDTIIYKLFSQPADTTYTGSISLAVNADN